MSEVYHNSKPIMRRDCSTCEHCKPWIDGAEWSSRACSLDGHLIHDAHYPNMFCDSTFHGYRPRQAKKSFWQKLKELFR